MTAMDMLREVQDQLMGNAARRADDIQKGREREREDRRKGHTAAATEGGSEQRADERGGDMEVEAQEAEKAAEEWVMGADDGLSEAVDALVGMDGSGTEGRSQASLRVTVRQRARHWWTY